MPTTRGSAKQAKLDDFSDSKNDINPSPKLVTKADKGKASSLNRSRTKSSTKTNLPKKRDRPSSSSDANKAKTTSQLPQNKKSKKSANGEQQTLCTDNINDFEKPVIINRSPVLQLWGSTVAQFLHSELSWETCLSIGNTISALCAITKGRALGVIEAQGDDNADADAQREKEEQKQKAKEGTRQLSVMGFPMHLKGSTVILSGKPKSLNESTLKGKFGEDGYEKVRKAMRVGLESWKGDEDELDRKAFHLYEKFRPQVSQGQQGWGRKGELNPHEITAIIKR